MNGTERKKDTDIQKNVVGWLSHIFEFKENGFIMKTFLSKKATPVQISFFEYESKTNWQQKYDLDIYTQNYYLGVV